MKYDPGFSASSTEAFTNPRVSALSARCTLRTSHRAATSAGDAASCIGIGSFAIWSLPVANRRLQTTTGMPNACARRATSWPMLP